MQALGKWDVVRDFVRDYHPQHLSDQYPAGVHLYITVIQAVHI
jgi:hypothetical protein